MSYPQLTFSKTAFTSPSVLSARRTTVSKVTLRTQLNLLKSTGRYDCFKLKWHPVYDDKSAWPVPPHLFWDSDIAKWIEGACYFLRETYDAELDAAVRELVDMIRGAQQEDGYLNLHYTVVEPEKRWSNLRDMHELYNAGHLIEAAIAHQDYYKNNLLVEPLEKYINLIHTRFGPNKDQVKGYPGHPEIELALLRFSSVTGHQPSYDLGRFFLEERGNPTGQDGKHYHEWEAELRGESPYMRPDPFPQRNSMWYHQAHVPIREQTSVEGHSVRAMYLLTAVADLLLIPSATIEQERESWFSALERLWSNMTDKKMSLTGGIGAIKQWEGFGIDYFLPQGTDEGGCYNETCASIALMMLAERMLHMDLDGKYADIMEVALYNNIMTAMSVDGKSFTYANQLASCNETKSERSDWFECACCPPNLIRLYGTLGGYLWDYGVEGDGVFVNVHLYTSAELTFEPKSGTSVVLRQTSKWPWEGKVAFELSNTDGLPTTIRLRLPAWSKQQYTLEPAAFADEWTINKGYLSLSPAYVAKNPSFTIDIGGFAPRYLSPHPYSGQHTLALARGPIVYCAEDADNAWEEKHFKDVVLKVGPAVTEAVRKDEATGEEYVELRTKSAKRSLTSRGADNGGITEPRELVLVPYYFRGNRGGKGHMRVGMVNGGPELGEVFPETM